MPVSPGATPRPFFGPRVVAATFVLAVFGWGVGFYGPPVYLQAALHRGVGDMALVSAAITFHFVLGAVVVANLPRLYRRWGLPRVTVLGALVLALGVQGWALAATPAQLFAAAALSGAGWVAMGAAAVNALIAPWYAARRPAALGMAYNGASMGGVLFSPLWVLLIAHFQFGGAAALVGVVMVAVVAVLAGTVFRHTPESMGQAVDGQAPGASIPAAMGSRGHSPHGGNAVSGGAAPLAPLSAGPASSPAPDCPRPLRTPWRERRFLTLCGGMALGLFAQIGLIAHLFSLLVPAMGEQGAGAAMGLCTACAVLGRYAVGRLMPPGADRRRIAAIAYGLQAAGAVALLAGMSAHAPAWAAGALCWAGLLLFGSGIGNATSLPPLIAQAEFRRADAQRAIPLIVAASQGTYAFAPAAFGLLRLDAGATGLFLAAAFIQVAAAASLLLGRPAAAASRSLAHR